jgi:HD-GYP domain-containing protein (c-di-GMP phosphodiesterase class II)
MIVPWTIYDSGGLLLMDAGSVIPSDNVIQVLLKRGAFHYLDEPSKKAAKVRLQRGHSPFYQISNISERLNNLFKQFLQNDRQAPSMLQELALDLQQLRREHPNALIGAVHLYHDVDYTLSHPIHCAILCDVMGKALGLDASAVISTMCAALSANISILSLQRNLHNQSSAMNKTQKAAMQQHPVASATLLKRVGVDDQPWLQAVQQHHWHIDGTGYPNFGQQKPSLPAQLVSLTDYYSAMMVRRAYRSAIAAQDGLRQLYQERGSRHDEKLCLLLIKLMGVYPPGSIVKLNSGEVAVVVKRAEANERWPTAAAILGSHGNPYTYAKLRDGNDPKFAINGSVALDRYIHIDLHDIWRAN